MRQPNNLKYPLTQINDHESRILALEELCRETNTNIEALRTLIGAVQNADYITSVTPIKEGSDVVGYTITFAKSEPITIYNGTDGKDGAQGEQGEPSVIVPEIGIKQDADGIYYWTIDGEWLTDDNGNKIPAVVNQGADGEDGKDGANGQDGKDGITPQLKIEGDYWYVSYDEGKTWTKLGLATTGNGGSGADSIFSNVEVGTDSVTFTMLDGTKFTVKFYAKPEITFEGVDEDIAYLPEQEFEIGYTIVGGDEETLVESFGSGPYWSAMAVNESATTGKIQIQAGNGKGKVVVIVTTGMGSVTMKSLTFDGGKVVGIEDIYRVDSNAGTLVVEFQTNVNLDDCEVISYDDDWLSIAETRAEMRDESLAFNYTANPYDSERWTWVEIYTKEGFYVDGFEVVQDAAEYTGPTLPEDIYPESISFTHSLLFVMHTGMNEGFSPMMVDNLLALAERYPEYNDSYNIVTCHAGTFASGDPANSRAANVVNQFYDISAYPYLFVNFYTTEVGNAYEETFLQSVIDVFDNHLDTDGADAGISIATEADADVIYVSAGIKAAVEQEYKVTAWLLENGIYSPNQAGAIEDYHMIYNHALRNIAGSYDKTDIQGESIGVIEMGATATTSFELDILSEKWSVENMEVLIIVSALNENNQWEVVNTKVCPINNSVDFYSNGSASGGGDNEEEDEWVALGDGILFDDFVSWVYGATPGNMATVAIEESAHAPGYYRMVNPFCEENMEIFLGGTPGDVTYAEEAYIEIDATDPNRVWIPFQPAGFTINGFGEIWIGYVSEERGKMEDGNISFPTNALGLFLDGDSTQGYYANTSGLFKVVLPGYVNKTEVLATPELTIENLTSSSFTVTWNAVKNAEYYLVNDGEYDHIIYDTLFVMENLDTGAYTVRVKAVADENSIYLDSAYAEIYAYIGALTPGECDWATCEVRLPTEDEAEQGYYQWNTIFHSFIGTGIVDIRCGAFHADTYRNLPASTLVNECNSLDAEFIENINIYGEVTLAYNVEANTEYRVVAALTNEVGETVIFDEYLTTSPVIPHKDMAKWVGDWTLSAEQAVTFTFNEQFMVDLTLNDKAISLPIKIVDASHIGFNMVAITGLSSITVTDGSPIQTLALINEEGNLEVFGYNSTGPLEDLGDGYSLIWLSYCLNESGDIVIALTDAWTLQLSDDGQNITTVARTTGEFSDGSTFEFLAMDIAALDTNYDVALFYDFETISEVNIPAGDITLTKAAATPSTQSVSMKQFSAKKTYSSSLVVRM